MFCTQCGEQLQAEASCCTACGAWVPELPPDEPTDASAQTVPAMAWEPQPVGETWLLEGDDDPADGVGYAGTPPATILEEPEPVSAHLRLEVEDVEVGRTFVDFELAEGRVFVIGRDGQSADFVPADPRSSRRHFSVLVGPEGFVIEDLGSSNGTYVNGQRVQARAVIRDGDLVEYGRSKAVFRVLREPNPWPVGGYGLFGM